MVDGIECIGIQMAFKGKAPGTGAGDISRRTEALRPVILLSPREVQQARTMRRQGMEPARIAETLGHPLDEIEKALVQMRMPRPETTRGTLNVTLAAHRVVMAERRNDEPLWQTFDRIIDELLRMRRQSAGRPQAATTATRTRAAASPAPMLPGF